VTPDANGLPPGLVEDLAETIEARAVLCVTGPSAPETVRTPLAGLKQARPVVVPAQRGFTTTGFAHTLYETLHLDRLHGPAPAERSAINRRIGTRFTRRNPTLVVPNADALRRAVLKDLVDPWKRGAGLGPCPLILTGSPRFQASLTAAADQFVYMWHGLGDA
jgi:hypothetical protein